MKNAALLASALFLAFAAVGCKSDMEKAADAICACSEKTGDEVKKCMDEAQKSMPQDKAKTAMKDLNEKDKAALDRAMGCSMKTLK